MEDEFTIDPFPSIRFPWYYWRSVAKVVLVSVMSGVSKINEAVLKENRKKNPQNSIIS